MRILICGDRNYTDRKRIRDFLLPFDKSTTTIIHGDCRGADKLADSVAKELGMKVLPFPAQWDKHGRSAGPLRNMEMLRVGRPDMVVAFHPDLSSSKGTKDMVRKARRFGLNVVLME